MNRLQKKCLVACSLMHGLLLVVLIFGTAFFSSKEKPSNSPHIIELQNFTVTDGKTGGGSPAAAAPAVPVMEVKPPEVVQPKPKPPEPKPEPQVEQPKPKPPEPKDDVSEIPVPKKQKTLSKPVEKAVTKPTQTKSKIDISKPTIRNNKEKQATAEAADRAAEKRARDQRIAAVSGSLKNLGKNLSTATTIENVTGGSGGGAAEINYGDLVLKKYDDAWFAPAEVDDNEAIVKARVVIARNGNVISADVIKASGNAILDKSVRRALELRFIHPFPEGSTDSQRTFIINFNLKTKRAIG